MRHHHLSTIGPGQKINFVEYKFCAHLGLDLGMLRNNHAKIVSWKCAVSEI